MRARALPPALLLCALVLAGCAAPEQSLTAEEARAQDRLKEVVDQRDSTPYVEESTAAGGGKPKRRTEPKKPKGSGVTTATVTPDPADPSVVPHGDTDADAERAALAYHLAVQAKDADTACELTSSYVLQAKRQFLELMGESGKSLECRAWVLGELPDPPVAGDSFRVELLDRNGDIAKVQVIRDRGSRRTTSRVDMVLEQGIWRVNSS